MNQFHEPFSDKVRSISLISLNSVPRLEEFQPRWMKEMTNEELAVFVQTQGDNKLVKRAKELIFLRFLPMLKQHSTQQYGSVTEDCILSGAEGLLKGVDRFKAEKGFKLSTFVWWYIRKAIQKERDKEQKSNNAASYKAFFRQTDPKGSLSTPAPLEKVSVEVDIQCALDGEPEQAQNFITLRYGLGGRKPVTLKVIGERYGMTARQVSTVIKKSQKSMRKKLKSYEKDLQTV